MKEVNKEEYNIDEHFKSMENIRIFPGDFVSNVLNFMGQNGFQNYPNNLSAVLLELNQYCKGYKSPEFKDDLICVYDSGSDDESLVYINEHIYNVLISILMNLKASLVFPIISTLVISQTKSVYVPIAVSKFLEANSGEKKELNSEPVTNNHQLEDIKEIKEEKKNSKKKK